MTKTRISLKSKKRALSLERYSGKWIAFIDQKVVAWADDLKELDKKIKELKPKKEPVYFLVPRKDEGPYILFFSLNNGERI